MKRKSYILLALSILLPLSVSCEKNGTFGKADDSTQFIVATKSSDEGDRIGQFSILFVRTADSIVVSAKKIILDKPETVIKDTVRNLPNGSYFVKVVTNWESLEKCGDTLEMLNLAPGGKFTSLMAERVTRCNPDSLSAQALQPYSGTGSLTVGENSALELDIERLNTAFTVNVHNDNTVKLVVDTLYFSKFNPSAVYIFNHGGKLPADVGFRALPGSAEADTLEAHTEATVFSGYVFESDGAGYTLNMKVSIPGTDARATITGIPVYVTDPMTGKPSVLNGIDRSGRINVKVNVYYNENKNIFKFSTADWSSEDINIIID